VHDRCANVLGARDSSWNATHYLIAASRTRMQAFNERATDIKAHSLRLLRRVVVASQFEDTTITAGVTSDSDRRHCKIDEEPIFPRNEEQISRKPQSIEFRKDCDSAINHYPCRDHELISRIGLCLYIIPCINRYCGRREAEDRCFLARSRTCGGDVT
jgi:hypothetical protein